MRAIRVMTILLIIIFPICRIKAQFTLGADFVSAYVWRGTVQSNSQAGIPNIQPYLYYTYKGLTVGSWASASFNGDKKEVDLYVTYVFSPAFAVTLTDYNWNLISIPNYFSYTSKGGHIFEANLSYTGPEKFPISASISTMFAGADKTTIGKQAFSTYIEVDYQINSLLKVFVGGLVLSGNGYTNPNNTIIKTGVTSVGLKASKSIKITDKFSLPLFGMLGVNPSEKTIFFVAGFSL